MSESKKSIINLVPDSIDNSVKNITDKPTKNMGTTLADIWFLVFGGISQTAEKRKLKYLYALKEYEYELQEKVLKIPDDKIVEPDIQIVAPALEASKYCIEKEKIREMFVNLISSSMHEDYCNSVHPTFTNIIKQLSPLDAKLLSIIYDNYNNNNNHDAINTDFHQKDLLLSLSFLESQGLLYTNIKDKSFNPVIVRIGNMPDTVKLRLKASDNNSLISVELTQLGILLCDTSMK